LQVDYPLMLSLLACTLTGMLLGTYGSKHISADKLKKGFGWFSLIAAVSILLIEI
jgi:uncharacterized protein